jgi:transcriptional antiterminator NusG
MQYAMDERVNLQGQYAAEWYAAYIKHQHEKKAAHLLERKGVEVFLPQQKVIHRWKDRNKAVSLPLFPGYLFLHSDLQDKFEILNTPGVFFLVENAGRACPIPGHEIDSIRRITQSGVKAEAHPFLDTGHQVRICSGPLSGVTGVLTRFKNQYRVVLTVELLQKAVSIEVEIGNVERIGEPKRSMASPVELRENA